MPASMKLCVFLVFLWASPIGIHGEGPVPISTPQGPSNQIQNVNPNRTGFKRILRFFGIGAPVDSNNQIQPQNFNQGQLSPCGIPYTTTTPSPNIPLCPFPLQPINQGQGGQYPPGQFPPGQGGQFPAGQGPNQQFLPGQGPSGEGQLKPYPPVRPFGGNELGGERPVGVNEGKPVSADTVQGDRPEGGVRDPFRPQISNNQLKPGDAIYVDGPPPLVPNVPFLVDPSTRPFNPNNPTLIQPLQPFIPTVYEPLPGGGGQPLAPRPISPINPLSPLNPQLVNPISPLNPGQGPQLVNPLSPLRPGQGGSTPPFIAFPPGSDNIGEGSSSGGVVGPLRPPGGGDFRPPGSGGDLRPPGGGDFRPPGSGGDLRPPGGDLRPPGGGGRPPFDDNNQNSGNYRPLSCSALYPFVPSGFYPVGKTLFNYGPPPPNSRGPNEGGCSMLDALARLGATKMRSLIINSGFDSKLRGYTVFVPLDVAFKRIPSSLITLIESDPKLRDAFVLNHFVQDDVPISKMGNEFLLQNMRPGANRIRSNLYHDDAEFPIYSIDGARIVSGDILTTNGRIHLVDKVIMPNPPRSAAEYLSERQEFESFWNVVKNSNLNIFQSDAPITMFIPINEVVDRMDIKTLLKDVDKIKNFVDHHVVNGTYYGTGLINSQYLTTNYLKEIKVGVTTDGYSKSLSLVNGHIRVLKSDIPLLNGVAHVIDNVISNSTSFYIFEDSDEFSYENGVISKRMFHVGKEKTLDF